MNILSKQVENDADAHGIRFFWHKKSFFLALVLSLIITAGQLLWIDIATPADGHVYKVDSVLTGEWWSGTCGEGKYSNNCYQVGGKTVYCEPLGFIPNLIGNGSNYSCYNLKIPNGEIVTVSLVKTPAIYYTFGFNYVTSIRSESQTYLSHVDARITNDWKKVSREIAFFDFIDYFVFLFYVPLLIRYRSSKE